MQIFLFILVLLVSYILGAIPSGLLIVRLRTGKDLRTVESGRTGGTNAMRAAGFAAGLATAIFDILKAAVAVWMAQAVLPGTPWLDVLAPIMAILGHNYSIFMIERGENGRIRLRGGAGGAPCVGGSVGLWFPSLFIVVPLGALILYFIGYASLATLSVALFSALLFAYRASLGAAPWEYVAYGVISLLLLAWALRPNIRRLLNGTERLVGLRAKRKAAREEKAAP